ncbi:hypothetical protein BL107_13250 [Synechococcus sp. BL107]|nr:hypothetical protein BL107_13250 [Synechococcus sp. BL107]
MHLAKSTIAIQVKTLRQRFSQPVVRNCLNRGMATEQIRFCLTKRLEKRKDSTSLLKRTIQLGKRCLGQRREVRDVIGVSEAACLMSSDQCLLQPRVR